MQVGSIENFARKFALIALLLAAIVAAMVYFNLRKMPGHNTIAAKTPPYASPAMIAPGHGNMQPPAAASTAGRDGASKYWETGPVGAGTFQSGPAGSPAATDSPGSETVRGGQ